jgi:hypothetical protein
MFPFINYLRKSEPRLFWAVVALYVALMATLGALACVVF